MNTEQFKAWLDSEQESLLSFERDSYGYNIFKAPKNEDIQYLYCQSQYLSTGLHRNHNFIYAGMYSRNDGLIYDADKTIAELFGDIVDERNITAMAATLTKKVRERVEEQIGNDRKNLSISEISPDKSMALKHLYPQTAGAKAREMFVYGKSMSEYEYQCDFYKRSLSEDELLEFIRNPVDMVERLSGEYLAVNQEKALWHFQTYDAVEEKLNRMRELPNDDRLQRIRSIISVVSQVPAKAVNVTIRQGEDELTLKMDAESLRQDVFSGYCITCFSGKDKKLFRSRFGEYGGFYPEDITDISYCGRSIYSPDQNESEQTEEEGLSMKM